MSNIPNDPNALPGAYSQTQTIQQGVSVPVGDRTAVIMGEGLQEEVLVTSAKGKGQDGFNSTYTSTKGSDGRHFLLGRGVGSVAPVVVNRSRLFKNGIELNLLEAVIDSNPFNYVFDARIDPTTGKIELQSATLKDQGGSFYITGASNVGSGNISNLQLVDPNAPAETWTVRCSAVRRDGYGNPIDGYAVFIARGSVSGILLDGYGNQITWKSNGTVTSNGVLSFAINDTTIPFHEGDSFAIQTVEGALVAGDSLTARYISIANLNSPTFYTNMTDLTATYGQPSTTNRLSLGSQIAFANSPPGVYACQTMPSVPRRTSYELVTSASGQVTINDLSFVLPVNVTPDVDDNINFFITDPVTGIEKQIIPNKVAFYDPTITSNPSGFVFGPSVYSYTVVLESSVVKSGLDGVLTITGAHTATFKSSTVGFDLQDLALTRKLKIYDSLSGNNGSYTIQSVSNGVLTLYTSGSFGGNQSSVRFQVTDSAASSATILMTDDLVLTLGQSLRSTIVDTRDANFFDAGWINAYEALEKIDIDMVVPLPSQTISVIFQNGKQHVLTQSNVDNRHERLLLIGAISGLTPDNVLGNKLAAVEDIGVLEGIQGATVLDILAGNIEDLANYSTSDAFGDSFRVIYCYPDQILVNISGSNTLVDGFFVAAAAAGYWSAQLQIAEPLTNKTLAGFTIPGSKTYSPTVEKNLVYNANVMLLTPVAGGGSVVWGKTTTISLAAEEQEASIVFIRDRLARMMRRAFKPYIGRAESPTTAATMLAVANSVIQSALNTLITNARGLTVQRDSVEPRQWNVMVAVQPIYGVNWVWIPISVGRLD